MRGRGGVERVARSASLLADGGGSPQCGSALQQGMHVPPRVHHRSPGVLAVSPPRSRAARNRERPFSMGQRGANRRTVAFPACEAHRWPSWRQKRPTWHIQLAKLLSSPHWGFSRNNNQVRSDAQCGSSQRSCSRFIPRGDTRRVISVRSDAQCDLFRDIFATRQLQRGALKIFDLETSARWRLHRRSVHRTGPNSSSFWFVCKNAPSCHWAPPVGLRRTSQGA